VLWLFFTADEDAFQQILEFVFIKWLPDRIGLRVCFCGNIVTTDAKGREEERKSCK
jgi:hypothetical protein